MMRNDGSTAPSSDAQAPRSPERLYPTKTARVDRNRAGDRLCQGQQVEKFRSGDPLAVVDHLALDQRDHGVAASEGEESDFEKRPEYFPKLFHCTGFEDGCLSSVPISDSLAAATNAVAMTAAVSRAQALRAERDFAETSPDGQVDLFGREVPFRPDPEPVRRLLCAGCGAEMPCPGPNGERRSGR